MKFRKLLSLMLALLMLLPMAVSCGDGDGDQSSDVGTEQSGDDGNSLYDANGYLKDNLPDLDFEGYDFKILTWESGYGGDFYVAEDTGNTVEDSVYRRNAVVENRLNVNLSATFIEGGNTNQEAFVSKVSNAIMAGGSCEYDLIGSYSMSAGTLAMQGLCANIKDYDYLDLEKPWWPQGIIEGCTYGDNLYFITGDLANSLIYNLYFLVVNRDMVDSLDLEDPREMVFDGTWTLDTMMEMTVDTYRDDDGVQGPSVGDKYGWGTHANVHFDSFLPAAGIRASAEDKDGVLRLTDDFMGQKCHDMLVKINGWLHGEDCLIAGEAMESFASGNIMFATYAATDVIRVLKDSSVKYGILPFPKYDTQQENYYCNVSFQHTLLSIPLTVNDGDITNAVLECMGSEAYRSSAPFVYENMLKSRFVSDELDGKVYDLLKANVYVDATRLFSSNFTFSQGAVGLFRYALTYNRNDWMSKMEMYAPTINQILTQIKTQMTG